jgi:NADPH-dependent curcumin reductase CurA
MTAAAGLEFAGRLQASDRVLITAAAGGTGSIAVQIAAKVIGCRVVVGTASTEEKAAYLRSIGCTAVVNYRTSKNLRADLAAASGGKGFDVVYEAVGGKMRETVWKHLMRPFGRLIVIGSVGEDYGKGLDLRPDVSANRGMINGAQLCGFFLFHAPRRYPKRYRQLMQEMVGHIESGRIRVQVWSPQEGRLPFPESVYAAQRAMRQGLSHGKMYAPVAPPAAAARL